MSKISFVISLLLDLKIFFLSFWILHHLLFSNMPVLPQSLILVLPKQMLYILMPSDGTCNCWQVGWCLRMDDLFCSLLFNRYFDLKYFLADWLLRKTLSRRFFPSCIHLFSANSTSLWLSPRDSIFHIDWKILVVPLAFVLSLANWLVSTNPLDPLRFFFLDGAEWVCPIVPDQNANDQKTIVRRPLSRVKSQMFQKSHESVPLNFWELFLFFWLQRSFNQRELSQSPMKSLHRSCSTEFLGRSFKFTLHFELSKKAFFARGPLW